VLQSNKKYKKYKNMTFNRSAFTFTLANQIRADKAKSEGHHFQDLSEEWKDPNNVKAYTLLYLDDQIEKLEKRIVKLNALREELENSEEVMASS